MIEKLSKFEMNVNSQNGEDGVLQEILTDSQGNLLY